MQRASLQACYLSGLLHICCLYASGPYLLAGWAIDAKGLTAVEVEAPLLVVAVAAGDLVDIRAEAPLQC
eukprot:scaffold316276_cov37-Prasinocladus_malaysianus.AAC.2